MKGRIARELWRFRHRSLADLYYWNPKRKRYGCLSAEAKRVLRDAAETITGMTAGPNVYWLPQIMSEAIEAAETLEL